MTYTRMRNQELSIKLKPSTSSSNIMYYPELVYNDVKKFIEEKYANEFLVDFQEKVGIDFFTSPYSLELVDHVDSYVPAYKIASADLTNLPLLAYITKMKKPLK